MKGFMGTLTLLLVSSCLVLNFNKATGAKILVVEFMCSRSHKFTYYPLVEELGKRGHEITMINPIKYTKPMKNVKELLTVDWEVEEKKRMDKLGLNMYEILNPVTLAELFSDLCKETYDLPVIKQLLKEDFDLVIAQPLFNDCSMGLIYRLKAPYIFFTPLTSLAFLLGLVGSHQPPSYQPNPFLSFTEEMDFSQRFLNFGFSMMFEGFLKYYYSPKFTEIYREKLGQDIPTAHEIMGNASLILSNGHFSIHGTRPLLPNIVEVGGLHSFIPTQPLPKDLEDFVQKGNDGFILFSMGSAVKGSEMPEAKRQMFLNVFSKLKQQVLWKWETETMPDLPKNVKLSKWLPQQDILGHKDLKMFITHCGGGSLEEVAYHGVPIVALPMFGDQPSNVKLLKNHGTVVELNWNYVTEESLSKGIQDILNDPKYRENAKKLATQFKDQPDNPLNRAVHWVEYVIRHKGAPHLKSAGRKLNWFQYHSYDVILTYFSIIGLTLYLIFATLRWLVRKVFCGSSKMDGKSKRE